MATPKPKPVQEIWVREPLDFVDVAALIAVGFVEPVRPTQEEYDGSRAMDGGTLWHIVQCPLCGTRLRIRRRNITDRIWMDMAPLHRCPGEELRTAGSSEAGATAATTATTAEARRGPG